MSGELRTSQFRWTTTANDDFVIGSPEDFSAHNTKFLIFQTTDTPSSGTNPHLRCAWNGASWDLIVNNGVGDISLSNVAYTNIVNTFTQANIFSNDVTVSGTLHPVGITASGTIQSNGALNVVGTLTATGTTNLEGTNTSILSPTIVIGVNPTDTLDIKSATHIESTLHAGGQVSLDGSTVVLNYSGVSAANAGIILNESSIIKGYLQTSADRASWQLKAPASASIVTLTPGAASAVLTFPAANGTLALKTDVVNQPMPVGYLATTGGIAAGDPIVTAIEKLDGNLATAIIAISSGTLWVSAPPNIHFDTGNVSVGGGNYFINYGAGGITSNTCFGTSLGANTSGSGNTAIGQQVLQANTTGSFNTGLGCQALNANIVGTDNTAIGFEALFINVNSYNTAVGSGSLSSNTSGLGNSAFGYWSLTQNSSGTYNTAFGYTSLTNATTATNNSAFGSHSLESTSNGSNNAAFGYQALKDNNTGFSNTAFGYTAGYNAGVPLLSLSQCTFLGAGAKSSTNAISNSTAIGYNAIVDFSNQIVLGNSSVLSVVSHGSFKATGGSITGSYSNTLGSGVGVILDCSLVDTVVYTLTSAGLASAFAAPINVLGVGQSLTIILIQPAAGSVCAVPTWDPIFKFFGTKNISTTLGGRSIVSCVYDGTYWQCTSVKDSA